MAKAKTTKATKPATKTRFTSYATEDLLERFRNAAYWLRRPITDVIEGGLAAEMARLEKANGGPFKPRK